MAFNQIRPFRYWCHKVLPLVYDDSLSYYELLCKVTQHLNSMGESVNNLGENVQFMLEEFNKLLASFDETIERRIEDIVDALVQQGYLVTSVNGQSGEVDIPALKNPYKLNFDGAVIAEYDGSQEVTVTIPDGAVRSVNGQTGDVEISASDIGGVPGEGWGAGDAGKVLGINSEGDVVAVDGGTGGVTSVNGYNGDVVIDAADIGAVPSDGWSSADSGKFLKIDNNGDVVAVAGSGEVVVAGVSSVNGQTGDVTISELPSPGTLTFSGGASGSYDGSEDVEVEIPNSLPNPQAITFTGAVSAVYNGAEAVEVEIPVPSDNAPLSFTGGITAQYDGSSAVEVNIPIALPTPKALTFTGGANAVFDGASPATVNIPNRVEFKQICSVVDRDLNSQTDYDLTEEIQPGDVLGVTYHPHTSDTSGVAKFSVFRFGTAYVGARTKLDAVSMGSTSAYCEAELFITTRDSGSTPEAPKAKIWLSNRKKCPMSTGATAVDNNAISVNLIYKLNIV